MDSPAKNTVEQTKSLIAALYEKYDGSAAAPEESFCEIYISPNAPGQAGI